MPRSVLTGVADDRHPLIVHSHLRWDFVWQRPQQLMSRFACTRPVLFVEEPVFVDDAAAGTLDVTVPCEGVHRIVPRLPRPLAASYDDAAEVTCSLLRATLGRGGRLAGTWEHPVQWFYTPMPARTMLGAFNERGVVYDCMDELSKFRFAPPDLTRRERMLMAAADVVFTGGYRLFESKARHHPNVHFFGCGVDAEHFGRARQATTPTALELRTLPRPILGYFGVIDERLDYELIAHVAAAFDHGSVVFVGPLAKVSAAELPRRHNLHWLGQRTYDELPSYVRGFDVCLMPFALNEATEYINPTKTLEYMAAAKPIVSTAVADVRRNFTPIVRVADSAAAYVRAVAETAAAPDAAAIERGIERARGASWDAIVGAMSELLAAAVAARQREDVSTIRSIADRSGQRAPDVRSRSRPDEGAASVA